MENRVTKTLMKAALASVASKFIARQVFVIPSPSRPAEPAMKARPAVAAERTHAAEPTGRSFRSLQRAVNRGWTPPQPDRKAVKRHRRGERGHERRPAAD